MSTTGWIILLAGIVIVGFMIIRAVSNSGKPSEADVRKRWRQEADAGGYKTASVNPICDICSRPVNITECYNLTTEQVATKEAYWEFAFTHQWSYVHTIDPQGDMLATLAQNQAGQSTAWSLCESCSQMFQFDREIARSYAQQALIHIPGGGRADLNRVSLAAAKVWKKLYGIMPGSIRVE